MYLFIYYEKPQAQLFVNTKAKFSEKYREKRSELWAKHEDQYGTTTFIFIILVILYISLVVFVVASAIAEVTNHLQSSPKLTPSVGVVNIRNISRTEQQKPDAPPSHTRANKFTFVTR